MGAGRSPKLSVIVAIYNMQREAPRTLYSLSPQYQQGVRSDDYEVIVVDNGSREPLPPAQVAHYGDNFHYHFIDNAPPSPARALNLGADRAAAQNLGLMVDGARIASPGIVALALEALERFHRPVVSTIAMHLGDQPQPRTVTRGYNQKVEDALLDRVEWRQNGYRLFEISALAYSSGMGWLGPLTESNFTFMPRALFQELQGFDERFDLPGGGFLNLDFYNRASELPDATMITLFGEATFHQFHGGIMTNTPHEQLDDALEAYHEHYRQVRGHAFQPCGRVGMLLGFPRPEIGPILEHTCRQFGGKIAAAQRHTGGEKTCQG